jgi:hypothetical protein
MIDEDLILSIIDQESAGNPRAVSHAGARGLMQVMPYQYERLGVTDPFDPEQNIRAGATILNEELDRFDGNLELALAAYNAGAGNVNKAIKKANGSTAFEDIAPYLPRETRDYVTKVIGNYEKRKSSKPSPNSTTQNDDPYAPEEYGSVSEFVDKAEALLSSPEFTVMNTEGRIRALAQLYNSKPWASNVENVLRDVTQIIWAGARPGEAPDFDSLIPKLPNAKTQEEIEDHYKTVQESLSTQMRQQGTPEFLFGGKFEESLERQKQDDTAALNYRERGIAGAIGERIRSVATGLLQGYASPAAALPEFLGFEETGKAIKNIPTKIVGEQARDLGVEVDENGYVIYDEFNRPKTKLEGSVLQALGQIGGLFGGGGLLKAAGYTTKSIGLALGGMNTLSSMDDGYTTARENGGTQNEAMLSAVLSAPGAAIDTLADMTLLGASKPFIEGLSTFNKAKVIANTMMHASKGIVAEGLGEGLQEAITQGASSIALGKNVFNLEDIELNALVGGAVGGIVGGIHGYHNPVLPNNPKLPNKPKTEGVLPNKINAEEPVNSETNVTQATRLALPLPEAYGSQGVIYMVPSPDSEVNIAKAFQDFQKSIDREKVFTVRHVTDVPTELLGLMGYDAEVLAKDKVRVQKRTTHTSVDTGNDLQATENRIQELQEELQNSPAPELAGELVKERNRLNRKLREIRENIKPQLAALAENRSRLIKDITNLNRQRKKANTPDEKAALNARANDLREQIATLDTAIESVEGLSVGTVRQRERLTQLNEQLRKMQSTTYVNDLKAKEAELLDLLAKRKELKKAQSEFTYDNPIAERGIKLEDEGGTSYIIPAYGKWQVVDAKGNTLSTNHDFLADALSVAQDIHDTRNEGKFRTTIKPVTRKGDTWIAPEAQVPLKQDITAINEGQENEKADTTTTKKRKSKRTKTTQSQTEPEGTRTLDIGTGQAGAKSISGDTESEFKYAQKTTPLSDTQRRYSEPKEAVGDDFTEEVIFKRDNPKPVNIRKIVAKANKLLRVINAKGLHSISEGGPISGNSLGQFNFKRNYIRIGRVNDIMTMAHEVAHVIDNQLIGKWDTKGDNTFEGLPEKVLEGLKKTARTYYPTALTPDSSKEVQEGFAMFIQHYTSGQRVHKDVLAWWNGEFKNMHPKIHAAVEDLKEGMFAWFNQTPVAEVTAFAQGKPTKLEKVREWLSTQVYDFSKNWFDSGADLQKFDKIAGTRVYDTYESLVGNAKETARLAIEKQLVDLDGNRVDGIPLIDSLNPMKSDPDRFRSYAIAKRAYNAYINQGREAGISKETVESIIKDVEQNSPDIVTAANAMWEWQLKVIDIAKSRSPFLDKVLSKLQEANIAATGAAHGYYVPFSREGKGPAIFGKQLVGSTRRIEDPIEHLGRWAENLFHLANKRYVLEQLFNVTTTPSITYFGHFIRKVDTATKNKALQELDRAIKATPEGNEMFSENNEAARELASIFAPAKKAGKGADGFSLYIFPDVSGEIEVYEIADGLLDAFNLDMPDFTKHLWFKLLFSLPRNVLRAGATTLRPAYQLKNLLARDFVTAWRRTEGMGVRLVGDIVTSLQEAGRGSVGFHNLDGWYALAERLGVFSSNRNRADTASSALLENKTGFKVFKAAGATLNTLENILSTGEVTTRLAVMKQRARELGVTPTSILTPQQALELRLAYKRGTTNYSVQGKYARVVNTIIPFFTARTADLRVLPSDVKNHPEKMAALAIGMLGYGILQALEYSDENWYRELDPEVLAQNILWKTDVNGQERLIQIPLETWSSLFWGIGQAIGSSIVKGDELTPKTTEWLVAMIKNTAPTYNFMDFTGVLAKEIYAQAKNKDLYTGRDIVPRALEEAPPSVQYTSFTSEFSKRVGSLFNVSPARIDHWIKALSPAGRDALNFTEKMLGYKPKTSSALFDSTVGAFLNYQMPDAIVGRSTEKFFDAYDKMKALKDVMTPEEQKTFKRMTKIREALQDINTIMFNEPTTELRDKAIAKRRELLAEGLALANQKAAVETSMDYDLKSKAKEIRKERKQARIDDLRIKLQSMPSPNSIQDE